MRGYVNFEKHYFLVFVYLFIDYFIMLDVQGCLNVLFKLRIRRQEVPHEDGHDKGRELGEARP